MCKINKIEFFAIAFGILTTIVKAEMDSEDMVPKHQFNADVTHRLTDNDIKLALSDLSLKDLKSLQTLIDFADYEHNDVNYQANSLANEKYSYELHPQAENNPDENDYSFDGKSIENDLEKLEKLTKETQRAKRDDQDLSTSDKYIKELVNSFPQSEELNYDGMEYEDKSYIRVKRN